MRMRLCFLLAALTATAVIHGGGMSSHAQPPGGPRPPQFDSPEVSMDRKITFRIHAPKAEAVKLVAGDIPNTGQGVELRKADNGIWEVSVGPVPPGVYRYHFNVDGVAVIDPRNPSTSESVRNTWSLVDVPGSELCDQKEVPHGAVAIVPYYSRTLKRFRRMHVYTPPGYERGEGRFPVLYLLHGAGDSDASWSTVGRAGFILDNLIAVGKAEPMLVVMPAGHAGPFPFGPPREGPAGRPRNDFEEDFVNDLKPYVESHYRVLADRAHRAIAGLSMGGMQTLNIAFGQLAEFGWIGVFSSGVFGIAGGFRGEPPSTRWEDDHRAILDDAALKEGLRLLWIGCGKEDFVVKTSEATVKMLRAHGFNVEARDTEGGHTWLNWRQYLGEFAPLLFREK